MTIEAASSELLIVTFIARGSSLNVTMTSSVIFNLEIPPKVIPCMGYYLLLNTSNIHEDF